MNYGFAIDNRKCIGCHACTVACKAEHDVPIGVNRTWVKYIEKGEFPNSRRMFSVMRCNHCADAPCVDICPTGALFTRMDGIVDFDNRRCIGCKACMQACPYDALYIDPQRRTAAKCNYCAHRIDLNLEPSCVVVCPERAIVCGDLDDPDSELSVLLGRHPAVVRRPDKGTLPKLFYIEGDEVALAAWVAAPSDTYMWSSQSTGVGHFAGRGLGGSPAGGSPREGRGMGRGAVSEPGVSNESARRVYDVPGKGVLWGWEVVAYLWTKAISAGTLLLLAVLSTWESEAVDVTAWWLGLCVATVFLILTGVLLLKDLDRPARFLYVLLRPNVDSWLVRGAYALVAYGILISGLALSRFRGWEWWEALLLWATVPVAVVVAVYTAFLFAQGKGRDFWQSPMLSIHMFVQALGAGAAFFVIWGGLSAPEETVLARRLLASSVGLGLLLMAIELGTTHATEDGRRAVEMIVNGNLRKTFWAGAVIAGGVAPLILLALSWPAAWIAAGGLTLMGTAAIDHVWVRAPQLIPLS